MIPLNDLSSIVKDIFENENFGGTPAQLYDPIAYTLDGGGKRIRPLMLLAATDLFGGDINIARNAAVGIEIFHNFTLLHDDLMDRSPVRRGKATVYRKWNDNTAILSGDAMNILAWRYFLKSQHANSFRILQTFESTSMNICEGQQYDMNFETRDDVTIDEYMEMIRLKTAVLLAGALQIGALYANASDDDISLIYSFGIDIGLAFQLRDDLLDAFGDTATFGKQTGTDIKDNKKTYPLLLAMQHASDEQRQRLAALFSTTPENSDDKVKEVIDIYNSLNIKAKIESSIAELHDRAMLCLSKIDRPDENKQPLTELAQKLLNRHA